jgi:uncharacterized membrane protein YheB (UPF0754 family)
LEGYLTLRQFRKKVQTGLEAFQYTGMLLKSRSFFTDVIADFRENVQNIIDKRLDELTPQLVKTIIQQMIRSHLGWLVVWGGVFGGLIGLTSALLGIF